MSLILVFCPLFRSLEQVAESLHGYKLLLRAEEVWSIAGRSQQFSNFCTKMLLVSSLKPLYLLFLILSKAGWPRPGRRRCLEGGRRCPHD